MKLQEVATFPGLPSKQLDLRHINPHIKDAYLITLNDGRYLVRYDIGSSINNDVEQQRQESVADFKKRLKQKLLADKREFDKLISNRKTPQKYPTQTKEKVYLNVPFVQKEIAKRQVAAKWDPGVRKWYVLSPTPTQMEIIQSQGWY